MQTGSPGSATRERERQARDSERFLEEGRCTPNTQQASCQSRCHSDVGSKPLACRAMSCTVTRSRPETGRLCHLPASSLRRAAERGDIGRPKSQGPEAARGHNAAIFFLDACAHAHRHTLTSTIVCGRNTHVREHNHLHVHAHAHTPQARSPSQAWGPAGAWRGRPENKAPAAGCPSPPPPRPVSGEVQPEPNAVVPGMTDEAQPKSHPAQTCELRIPLSHPCWWWPDPRPPPPICDPTPPHSSQSA